jgi:hypothetical protein
MGSPQFDLSTPAPLDAQVGRQRWDGYRTGDAAVDEATGDATVHGAVMDVNAMEWYVDDSEYPPRWVMG